MTDFLVETLLILPASITVKTAHVPFQYFSEARGKLPLGVMQGDKGSLSEIFKGLEFKISSSLVSVSLFKPHYTTRNNILGSNKTHVPFPCMLLSCCSISLSLMVTLNVLFEPLCCERLGNSTVGLSHGMNKKYLPRRRVRGTLGKVFSQTPAWVLQGIRTLLISFML